MRQLQQGLSTIRSDFKRQNRREMNQDDYKAAMWQGTPSEEDALLTSMANDRSPEVTSRLKQLRTPITVGVACIIGFILAFLAF